MSVKMINRGASKKASDNVQKTILQHQNKVQKPTVFHSIPQPSPLLSDRSEFPSLDESTGRMSSNSSIGGTLKYSDKLKLHTSSHNQTSENWRLKCDSVVTTACNQTDESSIRTKFQKFPNNVKVDNNAKQSVPKTTSDHSLNECTLNKELSDRKSKFAEQKFVRSRKTDLKAEASVSVSDNVNLFSKSNNQNQIKNPSKIDRDSNKSKDQTGETQDNSKEKKKKKRKSKVKRQATLQSGKITVLSPEVHYKILNQASALITQNFKTVVADINDEEEYPELGKTILQTNQKENFPKKSILYECQKSSDLPSEKNVIPEKIIEVSESSENISDGKAIVEKKGKCDNKEKIHSHDPITISFYDMLLEKNNKVLKEVKELKNETEVPNTIGLSKIKIKKNMCHPHNLLDSSSPAVKRGKEREKPKPKKPSQLKKIILLDRKVRKEHLLQMKNNEVKSAETEAALESTLDLDEKDETNTDKLNLNENDPFYLSDVSEVNADDNQTLLLSAESIDLSLQNETELDNLNFSEVQENVDIINVINNLPIMKENEEAKGSLNKSTLNTSCNETSEIEKISQDTSQTETKCTNSMDMPLTIPESPDSLLNNLTGIIKSNISDKERAAKILLHTRNFREYCNHLISKDIDDAVFALLDDLARFQDRLHQKDPVKARMKRRMIYGVKEVRKHIKLKKLKCIIIAVDIENVESQGGLNDVLNSIKVSAADHHIPCVFALSRKVLGKVCRKPVPVSCVGVFNFEGSEVNFKKMVELQTQSKTDYVEFFNKLILKLTDDQVATLLRVKKEAPEMLCAIRTDVLKDFFLQSETVTES